MIKFSLRLIVLACAALTLSASAASAAPADLDKTFGSGGVKTLVGGVDVSGVPNAVQADGKILLVYEIDATNELVIARINQDGSFDPSFGVGGKRVLSLAGRTSLTANNVVITGSGRILIGGSTYDGTDSRMMVWAVTPSGAVDTTFGGGLGYREVPIVGTDDNETASVMAQPDGDIVIVAGVQSAGEEGVVVQFLSPTGSVGSNAIKTFGSSSLVPTSAVMQADQSLIVSAYFDASAAGAGVTLKFSATGVYDATFGGIGAAYFGAAIPLTAQPIGLNLRPDGKIAVIGQIGFTGAVQMLLPTGSPSTEVAPTGTVRELGPSFASLFFGGFTVGSGRLLVSGLSTDLAGSNSLILARFNANGSLDPTFAVGDPLGLKQVGSGATFVPTADGHYLGFIVDTVANELKMFKLVGDYVAPPPVPAAAKFGSIKSTQKAKKFKKISGTASGEGLTKVEVAIQRVDSKLLKKSKKCTFVKSSKAATKNFKAVKGKCVPGVWLRATGTTSWSYKLKKTLKKGSYKLYVRAFGTAGVSPIKTKSIKLN
jgi:uncharacterized delta-60 repeat protein